MPAQSLEELLEMVREGKSPKNYCQKLSELPVIEHQDPEDAAEETIAKDDTQLHSKNIERISKANFCTEDADCVNIGPICPYGCEILVNRIYEKELCKILTKASRCYYMCTQVGVVKCEASKCSFVKTPLSEIYKVRKL